MAEPTAATAAPAYRSTAHASRAARGVQARQRDLFGPARARVRIPQKPVRHTPADTLCDALVALLAGAHGLGAINRLPRADPARQAAFGRPACAEQSVVQGTLDARAAESVRQVGGAMAAICRRHSRGHRHDYAAAWPILAVDLRGWPCGKQAALATPGYLARPRPRRGRQLGRVLFRGEPILAKDDSTKRARTLADSVAAWCADPRQADRRVGLVTEPPRFYRAGQHRRAVIGVAVRCRQATGQGGVAVLSSTLSAADALALAAQAPALAADPAASLLAYA